MCKYKIVFSFLMTVLMASSAYSQVNPKSVQTSTVTGVVQEIDTVGNTISILTGDPLAGGQQQMSFSVPGNTVIIRETQDIGLMDIKPGHPVTIQYDTSTPGKNTADNIVDNKPASHEE